MEGVLTREISKPNRCLLHQQEKSPSEPPGTGSVFPGVEWWGGDWTSCFLAVRQAPRKDRDRKRTGPELEGKGGGWEGTGLELRGQVGRTCKCPQALLEFLAVTNLGAILGSVGFCGRTISSMKLLTFKLRAAIRLANLGEWRCVLADYPPRCPESARLSVPGLSISSTLFSA